MRFSTRVASAGFMSAVLSSTLLGVGTQGAGASKSPDAASEVAGLAASSRSLGKDIATLRKAGLDDAQIMALLRDPLSVATSTTAVSTSPSVTITEEPAGDSVPVGDGQFATPIEPSTGDAAAAASETCGWAITNHDGSAFGQRTSRLYLRTDWCWKGGAIQGTPYFEHRSSVTLYGQSGGWRVDPSYNGSSGFIGSEYKTEAKANWRLLACAIPGVTGCVQVQSGTAFAQHRVTGSGTVSKTQGGWP